VIDVTNPRTPSLVGETTLPQRPVDVIIAEGYALVGGQAPVVANSTVAIVNIDDLTNPFVAGDPNRDGAIKDIGGRLAFTDTGVILGNMPSTSGGSVPLGGIRTARLGRGAESAIRITLAGGRTSVGTGENVQALAHTRPEGKPVYWSLSIDSQDRGVMASIHKESGVISVQENSKTGHATIRAVLRDDPKTFAVAKVKVGCDCETCKSPGACEQKLGSIDAVWSLGKGARGESAGNIFLRSSAPSPDLYTPRGLFFSTLDLAVEPIYDTEALRQVVAPQTLLDVLVLSATSYELRFYDASAQGEQEPEGHYAITPGSVADVVWRVEDASAAGTNRLRLTETRGGQSTQHEYEWNAALSDWVLRKGDGEASESRSETVSGTNRIVRVTKKDRLGTPSSVSELTYGRFSWGEELVREVLDPGGASLTTVTDYFDTPAEPWRHQMLKSVEHPDGSWVRYEYRQDPAILDPGTALVETEVRSWLDAPLGASASSARAIRYSYSPVDSRDTLVGASNPERLEPRQTIEEIQGVEVARTYFAYVRQTDGGDKEIIEERCVTPGCSYGAPGNLRTVTKYFASNLGLASDGRVASVEHPDGRLDTYSYRYESYERPAGVGGGFARATRQIVVHGTKASPNGIAGKTTQNITVMDERGQSLSDERFVFTGAGYALLDWTRRSYDGAGHLLETRRSNGEIETAAWGCCSALSSTDARGITTTVLQKDGLERALSTARAGVTTTVVYDGDGRALSTTRAGGGLSLSTYQSYDLAGRLEESADEQGLITRRNYALGGRRTTVSRPGGFTEITEHYLDGQPKSVTGTGVVAQYFTHFVNPDGTRVTEVRRGHASSPVFERSVTDVAGRVVRTERPGYAGSVESTESSYDSAGRLARVRTSGIADTLYEYDALGEVLRTGLDTNANGTLDPDGDDRISETDSVMELVQGAWWQRSEQRAYPTSGSNAAVVTGTSLRRLSGLGGGLVAEEVSRDLHGNDTRTTVRVDRATRTETRTIDVPQSAADAVSVSVDGRLLSNATPTGVVTGFDYDGLGRQLGVTDPRTGRSETVYDPATGRVTEVRDAAGRRTTFGYDPATGRKINECNPLGKCAYFEHSPRGEVLRTWGDVPYPIELVYDQYGRRTEMRTFRAGDPGWSSSTWPGGAVGDVTQWELEEATGLLLAKRDAVGKAVQYTYEAGGRIKTRSWARLDGSGQPLTTTYDYDPKTGELVTVDHSDGTPDVSYAYDRLGRQESITDAVGTRSFGYDPATLDLDTETITGATPVVLTHLHETSGVPGRPKGIRLGSAYEVSYDYDGAGRMLSVGWNVAGQQETATYGYTPNSELLAGYSTGGGQQVSYGYEPTRDLKTQVQNRFGGNVVSQYDYANDDAGRRTSVRHSGSAFPASAFTIWGYDDRNQLTDSRRFLGTDITNQALPVTAENRAYAYDPIGNRTSSTTGNVDTAYTPNALNQYTDVAGAALTHDDDGNLSTSAGKELLYNAENQLTQVAPVSPAAGDHRVTFAYDYMGRRVRKTVETYGAGWQPAYELTWVYDGWNKLQETRTQGGSSTTKHFVWGLDLSQTFGEAGGIGGLLASVETGASHLFTYDGNGNVSELLASSGGAVAAHYEYDAFGNEVRRSGAESSENCYRFATKYLDEETGLVYYGYRYYEPEVGRWTQRDPIAELGGVNYYGFAHNRPAGAFDLLGLWVEPAKIKTPRETVGNVSFEETSAISRYLSVGYRQSPQLIRAIKSVATLSRMTEVYGTQPETSGYLFSCRDGWIDLGHFFNSAYFAYNIGLTGSYAGGVGIEALQFVGKAAVDAMRAVGDKVPEGWTVNVESAYTPEDLESDFRGAEFGYNLLQVDRVTSRAASVTSLWKLHLRDIGVVDSSRADVRQKLEQEAGKYWKDEIYFTGPRLGSRKAGKKFKEESKEWCEFCNGDKAKDRYAFRP
jgi:RHS repeat-associated protein